MASAVDDRRRNVYESATTLNQTMLDETFRGGENQIESIATLTKSISKTFTVTIASPGVVTSVGHGLSDTDAIVLTTTGALPTGLTAGGTYYVRDKTADTYRLAATSGGTAINTSGSQSGTHTWTRTYTLRFADRPKYVGNNFYEGRATFPTVMRTIGDPQAPSIQFSQFEVVLGNMDGFYNAYLDGGDSYFSFIGARLVVQVGLRDVSGSFISVFDGFVPENDGFEMGRETITIRATDRFNDLNRRSPLPYVNTTDFPSAPADVVGKIIPLVLGDWEAGFNVTSTGTIDIDDGVSAVAVRTFSPSGFYGGVVGYYVGGGYFVFSIGTYTPDTIAACYVKRGDKLLECNFNATPQNTAGYWSAQVTSLEAVDTSNVTYVYQNGDVAVISVKVPYAVGEYSNIIDIAKELLFTLADREAADLNEDSWDDLAAKSTPAQSDFTTLKGRAWIGDEKESVLGIVLGVLEQVRVEMFIDGDGLIKVQALHPEDFPAPAAATRIDQAEVNEDKIQLKADDKTFFNRAWLNYGFTPVTGKTELSTVQKENATSISKSGKTVAKVIDTPNLYVEADAEYQLIEFLRFYSAGISFISIEVAWTKLLLDLGDFVSFNYDIGGLEYSEKPMMIRDLGINLSTGAVQFKLLSLANFPYSGYSPANSARMLSSSSQTIVDV